MVPRLLAAFLCALAFPSWGEGGQGQELLGTRPPEWTATHWMNSPPLTLQELRGKVVLVRWWTAPGCPFCAASAPALNEFHERYASRGLVVVGLYHHKAPGPLEVDRVEEYAQRLGFHFPVAVDPEWRTLREWWLAGGGREWTSVTFLLDRQGVIRHIHRGGQYVQGDPGYRRLKSKIEELLKSG